MIKQLWLRSKVLYLHIWLMVLLDLLATFNNLSVSYAHHQTTIPVTTCNQMSLQAAITSAAVGATIVFRCSGTITLTNPLRINKNLVLDGNGYAVTLDGNNTVEVLVIESHVSLILNALTIAHGYTSLYGGGGIYNSGILNIFNSTISNNISSYLGGGILNISGTANISNSTIANNSASSRGGGIFNVGGITNISNSTIANNTAAGSMNSYGGGIFNAGGTTNINNSTIANNITSSEGSGIVNYSGTVGISNSTIANNIAILQGSIFNYAGGKMHMAQNIIAAIPGQKNCVGDAPIIDQGYNLESSSDCGFTAKTDLQNTDPKLDPAGLYTNGGPTLTLALQRGSPALDHILPANCLVSTDQRGVSRPQGSACDIGAFELEQTR